MSAAVKLSRQLKVMEDTKDGLNYAHNGPMGVTSSSS